MCPFCIGSAVWIAAGTTSMGGVAALVVSRLRRKNKERITNSKNHEGDKYGQEQGD